MSEVVPGLALNDASACRHPVTVTAHGPLGTLTVTPVADVHPTRGTSSASTGKRKRSWDERILGSEVRRASLTWKCTETPYSH